MAGLRNANSANPYGGRSVSANSAATPDSQATGLL